MSKIKEDEAIQYEKGVSVNTSPEEDIENIIAFIFAIKRL